MEAMPMRTTVDIDERLIREAMALLKVNTKREAVQHSLEALVREARRRRLRSKLGDIELDLTLEELNEMRRDE
jgi:Arc/MetJ family transcription regulator